jgi:hypothetical protein
MFGVFVTFDLGAAYDAARLSQLAQAARPKFTGMPGLISKTFTLDDTARTAVNFYVWETEAAARGFFSEETLAGVSRVYGVRPTLRFVTIAARVDNGVKGSAA